VAKINLAGGAFGIEMADGTKYDTHDGAVDVQRPDHIRAIRQSMNYSKGRVGSVNATYGFAGAEGKRCAGCHFVAFAWQDSCPKCGTSLEEQG
jgi:hypothetical protein